MKLRQVTAPLGALVLLTGCVEYRYVGVPVYGGTYPYGYGIRYGVPPPRPPVVVTPAPSAWSNLPREPDARADPPPRRRVDRTSLLPSWLGGTGGGGTTTPAPPVEPSPPHGVFLPPVPPDTGAPLYVLPEPTGTTTQTTPAPMPAPPPPDAEPSGLSRLGIAGS